MLKYTQFCKFWRAQTFFKIAAQASEAGDFLNISLKVFEAHFIIKHFLIKKV